MMPFRFAEGESPFPPEELARLQRHQQDCQKAEARAQLASYALIRQFAAVTCSCRSYLRGEDYLQAMQSCPLHGMFIITTEDLLK